MKSLHTVKYAFGILLLLSAVPGMTGCRWASGPGDTVESPPRALVEKTFRVPPAAVAKGANARPAGVASGQAAAK